MWVKQFGGSGSDAGRAVAVDSSDNVLVTGGFNGSIDVGLGPLTSAGGLDAFVVKYSPLGAPLWANRLGGTGLDVANGIAVGAGGNVAVVGYFQNTANFGTGPLTSAGDNDVFLAEYSPTGAPLWSQRFGGVGDDRGAGVAVDGSGNVIMTGGFAGSVNFGGSTLVDLGGGDIFLAKYSSSGAHQWSKRFGSNSALGDASSGVAVDGAGNIIITGGILGSVSFGGDVLWSTQTYDIFAAKFTAAGTYVWSRRAGGAYDDYGQAVAADATGNVLVGGYFRVSADLGGGPLTNVDGPFGDGFIVKYAP